jgi:hypothetical protein
VERSGRVLVAAKLHVGTTQPRVQLDLQHDAAVATERPFDGRGPTSISAVLHPETAASEALTSTSPAARLERARAFLSSSTFAGVVSADEMILMASV